MTSYYLNQYIELRCFCTSGNDEFGGQVAVASVPHWRLEGVHPRTHASGSKDPLFDITALGENTYPLYKHFIMKIAYEPKHHDHSELTRTMLITL